MRLVCDDHLCKLARLLRMLGWDTLWISSGSDARIVEASAEGRVFLTTDRAWGEKTLPGLKLVLETGSPAEQLRQVLKSLGLKVEASQLFTRCSVCNSPTRAVPKQEVEDRLPPFVRKTRDAFHVCDGCDRIYWEGTHTDAIRRQLAVWGVL